MIKYSVIIPVYNRINELECCLVRLFFQIFPKDSFEIIICDDGSTENTLNLVKKFNKVMDIKYFWQPDRGFRAGQARNRGVDIMDSDTIIFLDSDIIVKKDWLKTYNKLHQEFPDCIICGRYDFLLPMRINAENVVNDFDKVVSNRMPITHFPKGELLGADIRDKLFERDKLLKGKDRIKRNSGGALFGGNVLIPKKAFLDIGGFDENIIRHGGEDSDFGQSLEEKGYGFIFTEQTIAWHIYHKRNQQSNWESLIANIKYIDEKHKKCGK